MVSLTHRNLENSQEQGSFLAIFKTLTVKQHEVFVLIAEGRSSKEIAWRLGVSDSAVNQRIEAVRSRAGSPTRAELARAYRVYLDDCAMARRGDGLSVQAATPGASRAVSASESVPSPVFVGLGGGDDALASSQMLAGLIVPSAFMGPNAALNRMAAMVTIAAGLLIVAMTALSVVQALAAML